MSLIPDPVEKAEARAQALGTGLLELIKALDTRRPRDLNNQAELTQRRHFLEDSLPEPAQASDVFERVINGNELQSTNYLLRGTHAVRSVARIRIQATRGTGYGTGFLIAPNVLITNNHVINSVQTAARSQVHFGYEFDIHDHLPDPQVFAFAPDRLFLTDEKLDFTVIAVEPRSVDGRSVLADLGYLPLLDVPGKALEGEWLTIVQHPEGQHKQLCVRENRLIKRADDVLWYTSDTLPGSSGSPVFNNDWFVVALHHSGVPERDAQGRMTSISGRVYTGDPPEDDTKWIANEGIRASRIVETLKARLPDDPLLIPLYTATPASARQDISTPATSPQSLPPQPPHKEKQAMPQQRQTLTLPVDITYSVDEQGQLRILGSQVSGAREASFDAVAAPHAEPEARFDAPFDADYSTRKGYDEDYLRGFTVPLPQLSSALKAEVAYLLDDNGREPDDGDYVLKYHGYSVVMHKQRKLALFSAANVSYRDRFKMSRPTDVWRVDPRIRSEYQVQNSYYARNKFDRGHLTRREDMEYGPEPKVALATAADTCHWTNCTPQHAKFNQNKEIWQGIERYILEASILKGNVNAHIITGAVFDDNDPVYRGLAYPLQFWKVVVALNSEDELFATAYLASQDEVIAQFGIEAAIDPFGAYQHYQLKVSEVERLTGLSFVYVAEDGSLKPLKDKDPLERVARRPRRRSGANESSFGVLNEGYVALNGLEDIIL